MMTEMSRRVLLGGFAACAAGSAYAESPGATDLMAASHEVARFANVRFKARLNITEKSGSSRRRDLNGLAKIVEQGQATARLIRVAGPADMRGVATLTVDRKQAADDLWVYLPSLRRVRRLVSSNRRDPWMGSDFSYGDILGHEVADWHHRIVRRETVQDVACTVIDSTPLRDNLASETGYSKRVTWLRNGDAFAIRADFFDLSGGFLKSMEASDVRLLDKANGKSQAMKVLMRTAKSESVIVFDEFRIDVPVADAEVAPESLKQ
jgi:hypothetical protein